MGKYHNHTEEEIREACATSQSYREVLIKLGYNANGGGGYETLKKNIQKYNIDVSHFLGRAINKGKHIEGKLKYSLEDILIENSPVSQAVLRRYIIRFNALQYKCAWCGCDGNWYGKTIALEIDHINGNNHDNRIENLRFLCPNCHAATETYCNKNKNE